jgi:copper(I)-binding protein
MLIGLIAPIEAGMKVPLTLEFRSGATVAIEAEARDGAKGQDGHHH